MVPTNIPQQCESCAMLSILQHHSATNALKRNMLLQQTLGSAAVKARRHKSARIDSGPQCLSSRQSACQVSWQSPQWWLGTCTSSTIPGASTGHSAIMRCAASACLLHACDKYQRTRCHMHTLTGLVLSLMRCEHKQGHCNRLCFAHL